MPNRATILAKITVGDIFHAAATNGASLLCLTMSVTESIIQARNVATQIIYDFNRQTGHADWFVYGTHYTCLIDSVAALPPDIHEIMLSLDRDGREFEYKLAEHPDYQSPQDKPVLNDDQRRGLLYVSRFYEAHPLTER